MVFFLPAAVCSQTLLTRCMNVDRLSMHLSKSIPKDALKSYLMQVKKWCPDDPVIHIDDSDVVKPDGYKFETLGWVRDGSESTSAKNVYHKGYHITEATVLTVSNHPVSIFLRSIPQKRRIIPPLMMLLSLLWSGQKLCSGKQPSLWTAVMTLIRCFSNWIL